MKISAQNLNNSGILISKSKLNDMNLKYINIYSKACNILYSMGYLTSPYIFDNSDFLNVLNEEYPEALCKLKNISTGVLDCSKERLEFEIARCYDKGLSYILGLYRDIITAKEAFVCYKELASKVKFHKNSDLATIKPRLFVTSRVDSSSNIPLGSDCVQELFFIEDDFKLYRHNLGGILKKYLAKKAGVSDKEFSRYKSEDKALFINNFSFSRENSFIELIITGSIDLDGDFGQPLRDSIENYYSNYYLSNKTKTTCLPYFEVVFLEALDECISYVTEFREDMKSKDCAYSELYVTNTSVLFKVPKSDSEDYKQNSSLDLYIGNTVIDSDTGTKLNSVNRLRGISGIFVSESDVSIGNLDTLGLPIELWHYEKSRGKIKKVCNKYYPIYNVHKKGEDCPLYTEINSVNNKFLGIKDVCDDLQISSLEDIAPEVEQVLEIDFGEHTSEFRKLVSILVQTLICIDCDYTIKGNKSPNHIRLDNYDWLDNITLELIFREAEDVYKKLGF